MFQNHKEITVAEESGIIRIRIGNMPDAILRTRISLIKLKPMEQYNPDPAMAAIEETKEVKTAMRRLGFQSPVVVASGPLAVPEEEFLHLPTSIRNVTMDEALDLIAKTFKGIVIYGACARPSNGERLFRTEFVQVVIW
jgi:hypothetical protein